MKPSNTPRRYWDTAIAPLVRSDTGDYSRMIMIYKTVPQGKKERLGQDPVKSNRGGYHGNQKKNTLNSTMIDAHRMMAV